ncbi:hypothetical protein FOCG_18219 [Fusarium oxysporum f. sp. radicis-lycopersici 26381]|nr:hypothetical protein FOCG_18219 [Fusarium oxysporum f. sp. radicis-lycopersici 26381]
MSIIETLVAHLLSMTILGKPPPTPKFPGGLHRVAQRVET